MSIYSFIATEHAQNVKKNRNFTEFDYVPFKDTCYLIRLYIKLDENDIHIYDEKLNFKYKGKLNIKESQFRIKPKLIYDLDANNEFLGGTLILEKEKAEIIQSGSALYYLNALKGQIKKVTKYDF
jgi:hypothetical protein